MMSDCSRRRSSDWRSERIPIVTLSKSIISAALGAWAGGSWCTVRGALFVASGLAAVASCGCAQFQADDLRELPSLHLPASGQRERVEEAHQVGHFVVGDGVMAEVLELVARHDGPLRRHDARADQLPERVVGDADDAGVAHGRVRAEEVLQLAWIDLEAAADDHLGAATHDR